ncbi:MAG TPA: hypothetical protein VK934_04105 [Fimbriimonas sp.]|nr:hypothetical protein [Fimbriimonas sp.]
MLIALAAVMLAQTFTLQPSDDLWVYPHASEPGTDVFLRVWGAEGKAAPSNAGEAESYSMAFLKWSLVGMPTASKLTGAKLILTQVAKPGYSLQQAKDMPLEARGVPAMFAETDWKYESLEAFLPKAGKDDVYGSGYPETIGGDTVNISIDLLKGKGFADTLAKALHDPKKEIAIGLTSAMDMAELGRSSIYKIYSRDERDEKLRPKLVLIFD